jgi:hypothetical protein
MNLAEELATTCVLAKEAAETDPLAVREQFESAARKETLLRAHAERLHALAKRRTTREDESALGYAQTGMERLLPIPYTGMEALLRAPVIGAGAYLGQRYGGSIEPLDPAEVKRVFAPAGDEDGRARSSSGGRGKSPLDKQLRLLSRKSTGLASVFRKLKLQSGDDLSEALRGGDRLPSSFADLKTVLTGGALEPGGTPEQQRLANLFKRKFGGTNAVRREVENVIAQTAKKPGAIAEMVPSFSRHKLLGGLGGVALASAISGLPFAVRALWQKSQGGEGAVRAREEAQGTIEQARDLASKRDQLLSRLAALKERRDPEGIEAAKVSA